MRTCKWCKLTYSFPPDYDPSKIKRRKGGGGKDPQMTIRLMAPFSMRCNKCGEYVCKSPLPPPITQAVTNFSGKGKKFNARKETAVGEEYYGIKIFRFYIVSSSFPDTQETKLTIRNVHYVLPRSHSKPTQRMPTTSVNMEPRVISRIGQTPTPMGKSDSYRTQLQMTTTIQMGI
jgi:hypothetical protein